MDGNELRQRRLAEGLTQAQLAERLHLSRDFIGGMERGVKPISERTAMQMTALSMDAPSTGVTPKPPLVTNDPMEQIIERALQDAGLRYATDHGGVNPSRLDFRLLDYDVEIEVKRFHTDRIGEQMKRAPNVIVAQGEAAVRLLADALRQLRPDPHHTPSHPAARANR
jgi:transcriptional regulator with XRE-family HTH domain